MSAVFVVAVTRETDRHTDKQRTNVTAVTICSTLFRCFSLAVFICDSTSFDVLAKDVFFCAGPETRVRGLISGFRIPTSREFGLMDLSPNFLIGGSSSIRSSSPMFSLSPRSLCANHPSFVQAFWIESQPNRKSIGYLVIMICAISSLKGAKIKGQLGRKYVSEQLHSDALFYY